MLSSVISATIFILPTLMPDSVFDHGKKAFSNFASLNRNIRFTLDLFSIQQVVDLIATFGYGCNRAILFFCLAVTG